MSDPSNQEQGALPPELADLAALAAAADTRNAAQDGPAMAAGQELAPAVDHGADVAAMLQTVMAMAEPVAPYLPRAYTPEVCERIGIAVAAVAEKRGWDLGQLASPEAMLLFVTVPPTFAAVKMAKDYYAWKEREAAKESQANPSNVTPIRPEPVTHGS